MGRIVASDEGGQASGRAPTLARTVPGEPQHSRASGIFVKGAKPVGKARGEAEQGGGAWDLDTKHEDMSAHGPKAFHSMSYP